jgi:preprotein translocase subunit SecA
VEEWDLPRLITEVSQYYPTKFTADELLDAVSAAQVTESLLAEALELYEERDETIPGGAETARQLERDVMLQIIDQRWRDHLADMDYLREGINLRAMGNQDPLVAWQRDGYAMFEKLMSGIDDDYLRYIFHVQVITEPAPEPDLAVASYAAADDPVQSTGAVAATMVASPDLFQLGDEEVPAAGGRTLASGAGRVVDDGDSQVPIVKSEREKLGRNDPCWCGSGKKFKFCHGAN